jgi:hypothetical protein
MKRIQEPVKHGAKIAREAVVIKDRFGDLDGKSTFFPGTGDHKTDMAAVEAFFTPHLERLKKGEHVVVDTDVKTPITSDAEGDTEWSREKKLRKILCEEIQAELTATWPGTAAVMKKEKAIAVKKFFGTGAWTAVENMQSADLKRGLADLQEYIHNLPSEEVKS